MSGISVLDTPGEGIPTVRVKIRGVNREFIVDSGSDMSLIKPGICHGQVRPSRTISFGVTGDELGITGEQDVQFCIANWKYRHAFRVCSLLTNADGIIGIDFLAKRSASLDIGKRVLRLRKRSMANSDSSNRRPSRGNTNYDRTTLTVFSETDVKQHKGKQTPKSDFETKRKARSKTTRGNASCRDAQVATVERQHGGKARKRNSRRSRKRQVVQVNQLKPTYNAERESRSPDSDARAKQAVILPRARPATHWKF